MQTDLNPFVYSRPIAPDDVVDRDEETRKLLALAAGGHYVRLYAPRKYGKTSLLRRVLRDAERDEGMVPVLVDLYGVLSLADVAVRVERAYAGQLKGRVRARIDEFLQSTGLGLSLSAMGIGARLQLDPRADPLPALHALLDLPLRLEGEGRRALVVLDEFQDLAKVREMDAVLRSHIQFHGEVASYVFSGSEAGLMAQLFEAPHAPLYGQAAPLRLGRLAAPDLARVRRRPVPRHRARGRRRARAAARGRGRAPAAGDAARAPSVGRRCRPARRPRTRPGSARSPRRWRSSSRSSTRTGSVSPPSSRRRSARVVGGGGSPYRTALLERLDLQKASAQQALRNLAARGEVERDERRYRLVDPLFAVWIERLASPPE